MRRADVVLASIPALVLGGFLAERATNALAPTTTTTSSTASGLHEASAALAAMPLFALALLAALGLICYEVVTANAIER